MDNFNISPCLCESTSAHDTYHVVRTVDELEYFYSITLPLKKFLPYIEISFLSNYIYLDSLDSLASHFIATTFRVVNLLGAQHIAHDKILQTCGIICHLFH